jgi:hypothetical protein
MVAHPTKVTQRVSETPAHKTHQPGKHKHRNNNSFWGLTAQNWVTTE